RDRDLAVHAVPLAARAIVRREGALGDALPVRRSRRAADGRLMSPGSVGSEGSVGSKGPHIRRFADLDALSHAAADELAAIARAAVDARGTCSLALSGGSTPKRLFQLLAQRGPGALPWNHIELWWGDERTVPPDHPDSNYRMTREALLDPLGLAASHVHP